jgi:hypothetical protein
MFKLVRGIPEANRALGTLCVSFQQLWASSAATLDPIRRCGLPDFSWPLRNLGNWVGTGRRDIRLAPPVYRP